MTRLLIVDDDALVRAGLRMILDSADDLEVVGEATDGAEVLEAISKFRPEVVLMDIRMPRMDGLTATAAVHALDDPPKVVVLTTFDLDDYVFRALKAGAAGFLLKDTPPRELIQGIRVIASGEAMLSPTVTRRLIDHFADTEQVDRKEAALQRLSALTDRENEVLIAVGKGQSNGDIATGLFMSEATVKSHVSRILVKMGAANRVQVAIVAHQAGLLD